MNKWQVQIMEISNKYVNCYGEIMQSNSLSDEKVQEHAQSTIRSLYIEVYVGFMYTV